MTAPIKELRGLAKVAELGNTLARELKMFGVKDINPHFDIPPHLLGFRGVPGSGRSPLIIEIVCGELDRDQGLQAAAGLATMGVDAIALTMDAHVTSSPTNPKTGEAWGPHEMQNLCDGEGACDTGLLTDCLNTSAVFAGGRIATYNAPYHWHEAEREVKWLEPNLEVDETAKDPGDDPGYLQGIVIDSLRRSMTSIRDVGVQMGDPKFAASVGYTGPGVAAHRDAGMIRALVEIIGVGLVRLSPEIASTDEERAIYDKVVTDHPDTVKWMTLS